MHERAPAPARARKGLSPYKAAQLRQLEAAGREYHSVQNEEWLAAVGPDGGLWSWQSSPHVLWLANVLAGVEYPL